MARRVRIGSVRGTARMTGYALSCVASALVLIASGISYVVVRDVRAIGGSNAIVSGPSIGAQNILLMGLESRTDWNGNILPWSVLRYLHAGSPQGIANGVGGNATNTLILIHIPAGGKGAVGVSIPRDDWVNFAGTVGPQQQGKIDQAYGVSMYYEEGQLRAQSSTPSQNQIAFQGNEAGRRAAVATVEALTGVHIDHFAEVNLDGFFQIANILGGVEVCLRHPVPLDPNSGFYATHAGLQHLSPAMSLAFVRQRDGLPNGDLDRTHRQQAFIDGVVYELRKQGVLGDLSKLDALLSAVKQYVITDSGWNLLDFAAQARSLTGKNLVFKTAPITGYATIGGQAANTVDPAQIQAFVHGLFYPTRGSKRAAPKPTASRPPAPTATVDVYNGGYTPHLAADVSAALVRVGYTAGQVTDTTYRTTTAVEYGAGAQADAKWIAGLFGVTAVASSQIAAGHVEILLSASAKVPVIAGATASQSPATAAPSASPSPGNTANGGTVGLGTGIPCVN